MANVLPVAFTTVVDANGKPVSGARLYTFVAGTETPLDTYSDQSLTTPFGEYVTSDAAGNFPIVYLSTSLYKFRITKPDGTLIRPDIDGYEQGGDGGGGGGGVVSFPTQSITGNYAIVAADVGKVFLCNASGGNITLTANSATLGLGFPFFVINDDNGGGSVTITPGGGQTIDGAASLSLTAFRQTVQLVSSGASGWRSLTDPVSSPTNDLSMANFKLVNLGAGTLAHHAIRVDQEQSGLLRFATVGGTVDALTFTHSPARTLATAYTTGASGEFRSLGANTIAGVTVNMDALGVKTIRKHNAQPLVAGDIGPAGYPHEWVYDGTYVILKDPFIKASTIPSTPTGNVAATNVDAAIAELAAEKQAIDADLTAIAALATTGFPARTAADTWALRTLTQPAAGLDITNPAGVAGNPTFALADDLAAVEGLATTGLVRRTAANTWTAGTTVATAEIADDAVTVAKLAPSVIGDAGPGKGASVAGAATITLLSGGLFHITGSGWTCTDVDFNPATDSREATLIIDGDGSFTHNATTLPLPGGVSLKVFAGDILKFAQDSGNNAAFISIRRATPVVESNQGALAAGTTYTFAHGLGELPSQVDVFLECTTTELGIAVGKRIDIKQIGVSNGGGVYARDGLDWDGTNIRFRTRVGQVWQQMNMSTGSDSALTPANWDVIIAARRKI